MPKLVLVGLAAIAAVPFLPQKPSSMDALLDRARRLLSQTPVIDGHNDYPWEVRQKAGLDLAKLDMRQPQPSIMTDFARLKAGGVGAQFWSVYVPSPPRGSDPAASVTQTLEQIDIVHRMIARYPDRLALALTAADIERSWKQGRIASLIGMEGGHSINSSLATLRMMHRLGARYMTLTHSLNTPWADSATDTPAADGLTAFGEDVIREMNRLGMLVDLSHTSPATMADAIRVASAPVIFSHSSARALTDVPRNVPDDILRLLPKNGGMVMVTFVPQFVSPEVAAWNAKPEAERTGSAPRATLTQVADHIDHIRKVAGVDHVGLGGDFDGISTVVQGLEDVSTYPQLVAELLRRGWSDRDVGKLTWHNLLRVMRANEKNAAALQK